MSITILKPGMMSSVQDLGRWGFQQFGVPIGGAMDKVSASLANMICGNDDNEAGIEMTLAGTSAPSGIGGINGSNLFTGDMLAFKCEQNLHAASNLHMLPNGIGISPWQTADLNAAASEITIVHAIKGPEFDLFNSASQKNFFTSEFTISSRSNRMGYRLEGKKFTLEQKTEMISTAVTAGIVQVTHEGDPIILMADAQTTGGYPRIARVCAADISLLAQTRPGVKIQLREIGEEEGLMR